jgi:hypothetical protein
MPNVTSGVIGVSLTQTDATPKFTVGTTVQLNDGGQAMYVLSSTSAVSTYAAVAINADGTVDMLTTTNAATTPRIGFAQTSIATGFYGWVQTGGVVKVNLAANCDDNVPLFTTGTPGVLDDATVTAGYVMGLINTVTISNATAVTCVGQYPHVGRYGGGA